MPPLRTARFANASRHPGTEYLVQRAKAAHRKVYPDCAMCGSRPSFWSRRNDVHHLVPVHVAPTLACEPANLTTLCRLCHFRVGHFGDWRHWNGELHPTIAVCRAVYFRAQSEFMRQDSDKE